MLNGIKIIIFGNDFDQDVSDLPPTLKELYFANNFNQNEFHFKKNLYEQSILQNKFVYNSNYFSFLMLFFKITRICFFE